MNLICDEQKPNTDWDFISTLSDEDIDLSDIPEITPEQMKRAILHVGKKPVSKEKIHIDLYLDADIVAYYRAIAENQETSVLINETLRQSIGNLEFEALLRRIIREELAAVS